MLVCKVVRSEAEPGPYSGMTIHLLLLGVGKTGLSHNRLSHHMPRMEYKLCWVLQANHYCNLQRVPRIYLKSQKKDSSLVEGDVTGK